MMPGVLGILSNTSYHLTRLWGLQVLNEVPNRLMGFLDKVWGNLRTEWGSLCLEWGSWKKYGVLIL